LSRSSIPGREGPLGPLVVVGEVDIENLGVRISKNLPNRRVDAKAESTTVRRQTVVPIVLEDGVSDVELLILDRAEIVEGVCLDTHG